MPTIVATPGAANANSYLEVAEFDTYVSERLWVPAAVTNADQATKEKALIQATRYIDALVTWNGAAATTTQSLAWPRTGMVDRNGNAIPNNVIPSELKAATAEFAVQLLVSDRTADSDIERLGITDLKAGPVSLSFKETAPTFALNRAIPDAVRFLLVPSWYVVEETTIELFKNI